ncbi:hypothetical protein ACQ4PT_072156 [Festuca glaucescens]
MDPNSTYSLKIRLLGNPKKARKEIKYFCFEKVIDCDLTNYKDLVEAIVEEYPPRYLEVAHVQYYDDVLKIFPEVNSDQELMSMFEKHSQKKVVEMFIAYCDPAEPYKPITEYYSDVHIQPENNVDQDEDSYLRNPIPENEHVGIDEENTYLEKDHMPLNVVLFSDKEKDKDYIPEDESEDESLGGSECESENDLEIEEDEEVHEADHAPNVEYNKEDPPMTEGSTYPNMAEFKLALSQHAVKYEFEYNTEKSAPHRFRGYCKRKDEDNCPWRIHASTTDDLCTVVVKKPLQAIGSPTGLVICTDAGQAVMTGVKEVFPEAEHRECMFHLVSNFKKKFHGKVFDDHLWAAAYSWNPYVFDKHWVAMEAAKQAATAYIRKWHNRLWSKESVLDNMQGGLCNKQLGGVL